MFEDIARAIAGEIRRNGGITVRDISILVSEHRSILREGSHGNLVDQKPLQKGGEGFFMPGKRRVPPYEPSDNSPFKGVVNLYPAEKKEEDCCDKAIFISFQGIIAIGSRHISFKKMLELFYEHMKDCKHITRHVCFIANNWDPKIFDAYKSSIKDFKIQNVTFEGYFIDPESHETKINIV